MERKKGDECFKRVGKERNRGKLRNNAYNRKTAKGRKTKKKGSRSRECKVREAGDLYPVKRARNKNLNSSLSFRQAALTFCYPGPLLA